jgi:hypothetical protein
MARITLAFAALMLAACQTPQTATAPADPAERLDPFVVMIDAERWGVIIDKAMEGVIEGQIPSAGIDESDSYRTDAALKSGAASLVELRNQVCRQGLLTGAQCALPDWPAWTLEPPTDKTPIEELDRRSQWLGEAMQPFTEAGCEAGRRATSDDQFCSVE